MLLHQPKKQKVHDQRTVMEWYLQETVIKEDLAATKLLAEEVRVWLAATNGFSLGWR